MADPVEQQHSNIKNEAGVLLTVTTSSTILRIFFFKIGLGEERNNFNSIFFCYVFFLLLDIVTEWKLHKKQEIVQFRQVYYCRSSFH